MKHFWGGVNNGSDDEIFSFPFGLTGPIFKNDFLFQFQGEKIIQVLPKHGFTVNHES